MRRTWILLMVVAMALAVAAPATGKKPVDKPPKAVPIAVSLDANPMWVHEGDDLIKYTVTLENKTSNDFDGIRVDLSAAERTIEIWVGSIGPNESVALDGGSRSVEDFGECDECALLATAAVLIDNVPLTQTTMSTPLMPYPLCDFDKLIGGEICIWQPGNTGNWRLDVTPVPVPTRPTSLMVTMRDGVPGNWCTLTNGGGGVVQDRWRPGRTDPVILDVYLPSDGKCLSGGAGGEFFAFGNSESFYLYTSFDASATAEETTHNG